MKKFLKRVLQKGWGIKGAAIAVFLFGVLFLVFVVRENMPVGAGMQPSAAKKTFKTAAPVPSVTKTPAAGRKNEMETAGEEKAEDRETIHLGFAGDICLDETSAVMRHMKQKGGFSKVISKKLVEKMQGYDCMVINNEFSVSKRGEPMEGKAYTFRSHPSNLKYLKTLGIDVAGLALSLIHI